MLTEAIGEMLPAIMAIALTPLQLVGVVLVLGGPNGRAGGPSFLIGWLAALGAVTWWRSFSLRSSAKVVERRRRLSIGCNSPLAFYCCGRQFACGGCVR